MQAQRPSHWFGPTLRWCRFAWGLLGAIALGLEAILLFADSLLGASVAPVAPAMASASPPDGWFAWVMLGLVLSVLLVVVAVVGVTRTSPLFECGAILASGVLLAYALRSSVKLTLAVPPGVIVGLGWGALSVPILLTVLARRRTPLAPENTAE